MGPKALTLLTPPGSARPSFHSLAGTGDIAASSIPPSYEFLQASAEAENSLLHSENTDPDRMSSAAAVTDASFEQDVLKSDVPVLVDFWAPWCGPCRMVAPIVDEISKEFEGKIKVFKLNTDENPNVASQYGIRSIPTLMIFKDGQKVDTVVGAVPKTTLSGTISKYL